MSKISIVTAFFDIGRGFWTPEKGLPHYLQRSNETYIERFSHLLKLETDITVFTSKDMEERLWREVGDRKFKTTIVPIDLSVFAGMRERIREIQQLDSFKSSINPSQIKNPEYWNPDYVLVTNLKAYFTNLAVMNDYTENDMVAWIDFGYCRSSANIPESNNWEYDFDPSKIHLFSYKPYDGKPLTEIINDNDVYILGAKVVAHKSMWPTMNLLMNMSYMNLSGIDYVDDDQGLWLLAYLLSPSSFELHTIPDHQKGHDPFVLFNEFNNAI